MEVLCLYAYLGGGWGSGLKVPAGLSWDSQSRVNGTHRELWLTGPTLKHSTGCKRSTGVNSAGQKAGKLFLLFYATDLTSLWNLICLFS